MTPPHPLLVRQLRRLGLDPATPPDPERWAMLLDRISETYADQDEERYAVERAFTISSAEMEALNVQLRRRSDDAVAIQEIALETMRDGFVVSDRDGRVIAHNRRFEELLPMPAEVRATLQARLAHLATLVRDPEAFTERARHQLADPGASFEDEIHLLDGRVLERFVAPVVAQDGTMGGWMAVFRDVTDEIRAREALEQAKVAAENASQTKTQFLANMSHELRTPLNAIVGFARVLSDRPSATPAQAQYLDYILSAGEHMTSLVNDLLDLRRVEEGKLAMQLGEHALDGIVEAAIQMVRPLVVEHAHDFEMVLAADAQAVRCDPRALLQVLVNLLSNAAKYTPHHGRIRLSSVASTDGVRIEVTDNGVGIAAEDLPYLFHYFVQVGAKHAHHMRGSGVGLALTKQLVEKMGGSIEVESEPQRGSTFRVRLPRSAA